MNEKKFNNVKNNKKQHDYIAFIVGMMKMENTENTLNMANDAQEETNEKNMKMKLDALPPETQVALFLEEVRPMLRDEGGDLEFVGLEDNVVQVKLSGACRGCPSSVYTLKMGVEAFLKEKLPWVQGVEEVEEEDV